jgi:hypothetical protein
VLESQWLIAVSPSPIAHPFESKIKYTLDPRTTVIVTTITYMCEDACKIAKLSADIICGSQRLINLGFNDFIKFFLASKSNL